MENRLATARGQEGCGATGKWVWLQQGNVKDDRDGRNVLYFDCINVYWL